MDEKQPKIEVRHSGILIHNYELHDSQVLEDHLSVYDPIKHRKSYKGMMWDEEKKILYIPRGIDINFL